LLIEYYALLKQAGTTGVRAPLLQEEQEAHREVSEAIQSAPEVKEVEEGIYQTLPGQAAYQGDEKEI